MTRPFYTSHADLYDKLITDPVEPWVAAVHALLGGVPARSPGAGRAPSEGAPARILDAGCGTGRHAAALIALGHRVDLADASAELLALAARRCPGARTMLVDLCAWQPPPDYDAVACRGVLNDMITDEDRAAAVTALASALRPGGRLFLDVRDAAATRARSVTRLSYTSHASWDGGLLTIAEQFGDEPVHHFTMRPWTIAELTSRLTANGLTGITIDPGVGRRTPDRLFVTATRAMPGL
ncbi:class I SAM-dependent methyltransferase [Actinoplanes sp. N902-109]|uniref:methyltransferase domain-containing protein n=1 Tax=Actinoplanes sp. (strain N902-109) TaxID=649831 RepID=UPI00032952BF|nr:class I SAM-dependent methyltransferase [Actinoplanes sp. N902-109]AGL15733.1 putative methyltransferase [Actinoplanes sp. N902-109]